MNPVGSGGELAGQVCLVTGATRGIGRAIAERFAAEGAIVGVGGRRADDTATVAASLPGPGRGVALSGDLADPAVAGALVDGLVAAAGRLDVLVNNAGVALDGYLTRLGDDDWARSLDVNLSAPFRLTRAAVPVMKQAGGGTVVNVVSWAGLRGNPGQAAYASAKAGLVGLTLTTAKELARFGIRVNALSPSADTEMTATMTDERRRRIEAMVPLGRLGTLAEAADGALFLAGPRSSFVTGQVLNVDGGLHLS